MPEPNERQPVSRLPQAPRPPCLLAGVIERRKLVAAQLNELRRQAAVVADPGADLRRIESHHQRAAFTGRHQLARRVIVIGSGMEPEYRALGDANMVTRDDPGQQGARRQAWTVAEHI